MDNSPVPMGDNYNQGPGFNPNSYTPTYQQGPAHLGGSGPFVIRTKLSNRCLDVSQTNDWGNQRGDLILYDYVGGQNQQWNIIPEGDYILLRSVKSGNVLDAYYQPPHNQNHNPRARETSYSGSLGQKLKFVEVKPGTEEYYIYVADGKVLDVSGEDGRNNIPVIPYTFHGKDNQIWTVTPSSSVAVKK